MVDLSGLLVQLLHSDAKLPTKTFGSAGYDLYSTDNWLMGPGERRVFPIGIATEIPHGYFGKIMDRSGLAAKRGITVLGGVIDNDYRGEWKVVLLNTHIYHVPICRGDRIAQVVFMPYGHFDVSEVMSVSDTARGSKGFGSSGR